MSAERSGTFLWMGADQSALTIPDVYCSKQVTDV